MKVARFSGTEETKRLIGNITRDFQKEAPYKSHVDFSLMSLDMFKKAELHTDENNGSLRDLSVVLINGCKAFIQNFTGEVFIEKRPFFSSPKTSFDKIIMFLKIIQPENMHKNELKTVVEDINNSHKKITSTAKIGDTKYQKITESSDCCGKAKLFLETSL